MSIVEKIRLIEVDSWGHKCLKGADVLSNGECHVWSKADGHGWHGYMTHEELEKYRKAAAECDPSTPVYEGAGFTALSDCN